jgi:two-component system, NarL family, sensor histidine kinase FusK
MMGKGLWTRPWVRHIAVAVGYGLTVVLFRELSNSQWTILAGLRLTVFLIAPYAYWPALIIGESGYFIGLSIQCEGELGMTWAILNAIPSSLYLAPFLYWIRKRLQPMEGARSVDMGILVGAALSMSLAVMLISIVLIHVMRLPAGYKIHNFELIIHYFIGNYVGILTVTPLALFICQAIKRSGSRLLYRGAADSRLFSDTVIVAFPIFVFLLWLGISTPPHAPARQMVQVAMFLPVVWLALRHGSLGAAIGGTVASCAVMLLMPEMHDPSTLRAEAVLAFAISTMLLMGGRITALDRRMDREKYDIGMAYALAQRNVYVGEMQLRMTSHALEQIQETIQVTFAMVMGRLRQLQPALDDQRYLRQVDVAQNQLHYLADGLYPKALRDKGLPHALMNGALTQLLDDCGLTYSCDLRGPLSQLSYTVRMTIYRIVWEAIAEACSRKNFSDARVRIKGINEAGRLAIIISIRFRVNFRRVEDVRWDDLLSRIGRSTSGLGFRAIQDRAALFSGRTHRRVLTDGWRISVLLFDSALPSNFQ